MRIFFVSVVTVSLTTACEYSPPAVSGAGGQGGEAIIELDWVALPAGSFDMGSALSPNEQPVHQVNLPDFQLTRNEITVAEYMQCVTAKKCPTPNTWSTNCYWNSTGFDEYPINCVTWEQSAAFCAWAGGRLPSEAEWEYAARSAGQMRTYPWGEDLPTCELAVTQHCGLMIPKPVCSTAPGNTTQGLCDMSGNVFEWVQDNWHDTYDGAPTDGSAWEGGATRVVRGGHFDSIDNQARTSWRKVQYNPSYNNLFLGVRCAR